MPPVQNAVPKPREIQSRSACTPSPRLTADILTFMILEDTLKTTAFLKSLFEDLLDTDLPSTQAGVHLI